MALHRFPMLGPLLIVVTSCLGVTTLHLAALHRGVETSRTPTVCNVTALRCVAAVYGVTGAATAMCCPTWRETAVRRACSAGVADYARCGNLISIKRTFDRDVLVLTLQIRQGLEEAVAQEGEEIAADCTVRRSHWSELVLKSSKERRLAILSGYLLCNGIRILDRRDSLLRVEVSFQSLALLRSVVAEERGEA